MRILINAAGSAAAPTIIKHIKSLGHSVIGIDASVESEKYAMTYCDEYFISPMAADPNFIKFMAVRTTEVQNIIQPGINPAG